MLLELRREISPPPTAFDLAGQDLASSSTTWTALPDLGEMTVSAADSRRELDYMHARFRSPLTSRFLSTDPAGANPRKPQSWNRYTYVMGNPLKYTDPTGELPNKIELLWNRWKHIFKNHVLKDVELGKSKFKDNAPNAVKKTIEKTVNSADQVIPQEGGNRLLHVKTFNAAEGSRGETVVGVVTEPQSETRHKVITTKLGFELEDVLGWMPYIGPALFAKEVGSEAARSIGDGIQSAVENSGAAAAQSQEEDLARQIDE